MRDTGVGIASEMLPRVFDLFVQVNRRLDRAQGGLGLGLTLVQELVELHGGSVAAHSDGPGRGSEFTVRLPLSRAPSGEFPVPRRRSPKAEATGRRVLIAEDNTDAREFLHDLLTLWGHQVDVAEDGNGAVELSERSGYDLALIDIGLPGLNGFEVARRIRSIETEHGREPRTFLVALTGYGQPEDRRRALESGFDEHCVKPLDTSELRALLAREDTLVPREVRGKARHTCLTARRPLPRHDRSDSVRGGRVLDCAPCSANGAPASFSPRCSLRR